MKLTFSQLPQGETRRDVIEDIVATLSKHYDVQSTSYMIDKTIVVEFIELPRCKWCNKTYPLDDVRET